MTGQNGPLSVLGVHFGPLLSTKDLGDGNIEMLDRFEYDPQSIQDAQVKEQEAKQKKILDDAIKDDEGNLKPLDSMVEIPTWRQALVNFQHPFLEQIGANSGRKDF